MKKTVSLAAAVSCLAATLLLAACGLGGSGERFLGEWSKTGEEAYGGGPLRSVEITREGENYFVKVNCDCAAKGKFLATAQAGKLQFSVPQTGAGYAAWIDKGRINVLGDEFAYVGPVVPAPNAEAMKADLVGASLVYSHILPSDAGLGFPIGDEAWKIAAGDIRQFELTDWSVDDSGQTAVATAKAVLADHKRQPAPDQMVGQAIYGTLLLKYAKQAGRWRLVEVNSIRSRNHGSWRMASASGQFNDANLAEVMKEAEIFR